MQRHEGVIKEKAQTIEGVIGHGESGLCSRRRFQDNLQVAEGIMVEVNCNLDKLGKPDLCV